jgi:hypothetical protein
MTRDEMYGYSDDDMLDFLRKEWETIITGSASDIELSKKRQQFMIKLFSLKESIQ